VVQGRGHVKLHIERLDLIGGLYYVDVGVHEREWSYAYDYHRHVYPLRIRWADGQKGILRPPHRWEIGGALALQGVLPALETP
jgi:lipopolysaccharide transport system ATP-binding protein